MISYPSAYVDHYVSSFFGAAEREAYNAAERAERKQHTKEKVLHGFYSIKLKSVRIRSK